MPEVSSKYEEIWSRLQKKIGLDYPIPPVYDSLEDFDNLYRRLSLDSESSESEIDKFSYQLYRKSLEEDGSLLLFGVVLDERLEKYASINLSERYKAKVLVAGIILPPSGEEKTKFLHESIHALYIECFPEFAITINYPPALVGNEATRILIRHYFEYLNEATTWLTTIRMSDVIKLKREEAWKLFYGVMNRRHPSDSKIIKSMVDTIFRDNHDFLDPLEVLLTYGLSSLRIYLKELKELGLISRTTTGTELGLLRKSIIPHLKFMKLILTSSYIECHTTDR
jgi:hypothetical protein